MKKYFTPIVTIFCLLSLLLSQQFLLKAELQKPFSEKTKGLYKLPRTEILKLAALGYTTTLADYLWINLILKIGQSSTLEEYEEHVIKQHGIGEQQDHENHFITKPTLQDSLIDTYLTYHLPDIFYNYIDRITDLDPDFLYPYLVAFTFALQPEYYNPESMKHLLKKGLERHSDYWEMPFFYAFYLYTNENATDSLVLTYLRNSLNAHKSIRVFEKKLVLNTFIAFSQKMSKESKNNAFVNGIISSLNNPSLQKRIQKSIKSK